jgi:L-asparaginase / beta-aspartyl-peptidase
VPEKTAGPKWRPALPDTIDRFIDRVRDEPEHPADFSEKRPSGVADTLDNHHGIVRDDEIFVSFGLVRTCHLDGEGASVRMVGKGKVKGEGAGGMAQTRANAPQIGVSFRLVKKCLLTGLLFCALYGRMEGATVDSAVDQPAAFALAIHGGAGTIDRGAMTPENEKEYRRGLEEALQAGAAVLRKEGSSLDAVEAAVRVLEDNPLFNAGRGAVFTSAGTNELDAAIMDGKTLKAGSVFNLKHVKNPVSLARLVMEKTSHVMLDCEGAEALAKENGMDLVEQKYFFTERRWQELQRAKEAKKANRAESSALLNPSRHGTVGAVARDWQGNLAAATSTGGTTNKLPGRVGDSPIVGAGTYANNATCAVSATGDGEYFIRAVVAHEVSALMEHKGMSIDEAAESALAKVGQLGGTGGMIAMDRNGHVAMPFNTSGMYRGLITRGGRIQVEIYK